MLGKDIFVRLSVAGFYVFGVDQVKSLLLPEESQIIGDITDNEFVSLVLKKVNPDIIIHCAAIVNLNTCEENHKLAFSLHVESTENLARYKPGVTKIIYISTDSVFDGEKGDYAETDIPNPLNYYAKSKLEGENAAKLNPEYIVIRTNIYGFNIPLKNSLAEWAIKNFSTNNSIQGFSDVVFNAVYTKQLADIIRKLIQMDYKGLINVASKDFISKYEFLVNIARAFGTSEKLIEETSSENFHFAVPRPKKTYLNIKKLEKLLPVPNINSGIMDMIKDFNNQKS